jgi:succinoglycan biosynthesis protein ExoL
MKRIVFIVPHLSQPRFHKRAKILINNGYMITVYGFERGLYANNKFPDIVDVKSLGEITSGKYIKRIPTIIKNIYKIKRIESKNNKQAKLIISFGLDCALMGLIIKNKKTKFIYEVGDIRNINPFSSIFNLIMFYSERIVLNISNLIILTSPAYMEDKKLIYHAFKKKTFIIQNMLPNEIKYKNPRSRLLKTIEKGKIISIGFVGYLRYKETLFPFIEGIIKNKEKYELHIYGDGDLRSEIEVYSKNNNNINYYGPFNNPDDLASIYKKIDLSFAVYNSDDLNVRLAVPNKLYESIYFGVPLIVADNTYISQIVRDKKIGFIASMSDKKNNYESLLSEINYEKINMFIKNMFSEPDENCIEDMQYIAKNIIKIINN